LDRVWKLWDAQFSRALAKIDKGGLLDEEVFKGWTRLVGLIRKNEPRFLLQIAFNESYDVQIRNALQAVGQEARSGPDSIDPEEYQSKSERLSVLATTIGNLAEVVDGVNDFEIDTLKDELEEMSEVFRKEAAEFEPPDHYDDDERPPQQGFNIDALFADL
jgi:hypothetical protein